MRSEPPAAFSAGPPPAHDPSPARLHDPLRYCVIATVSLLTWLAGAPAVAVFASLGLVAYARAWRRGLTSSKCVLGDVRLVLAYLAAIAIAGVVFTVRRF